MQINYLWKNKKNSHGSYVSSPQRIFNPSIDTNVEFVKAVVLDPAFRQGEATTSYVEEFWLVRQKIFSKEIKRVIFSLIMTKKKEESEEEIIPTITEESSELELLELTIVLCG